jgi:hypothetical protein
MPSRGKQQLMSLGCVLSALQLPADVVVNSTYVYRDQLVSMHSCIGMPDTA